MEKLQLEELLDDLQGTLRDKVAALLDLVHLGLGLVTLRLPTSEFAGEDLPAQVWAVYDLPTHKRLSVGFDGFRRGSSLSTAAVGVYTFSPVRLLRAIFDIRATLLQVGAGESLAVTAGLAGVEDTDEGAPFDPTVASARFSPVPTVFAAHAFIDLGAADRDQKATVDARSTTETHLDAQVLSNQRTADRPTLVYCGWSTRIAGRERVYTMLWLASQRSRAAARSGTSAAWSTNRRCGHQLWTDLLSAAHRRLPSMFRLTRRPMS